MNVIGVNGGNGVLLHPFKKHLICNFEPRAIFHSKGEKQWNANFSVPIFKKRSDFDSYMSDKKVDVVLGAPDCGHSSMLAYSRAKKMGDPEKNDSLLQFIDVVKKYRPKIFLMENLPALLKNLDDEFFQWQLPKYDLLLIEEPVTFFGNSQTKRIRLVMIGIRRKSRDMFPSNKRFLSKKQGGYPLLSTGDLFKGLKLYDLEKGHVRENDEKMISMYWGDHNRLTVSRTRQLWNRLELSRRWEVNRERMKNQPGVYRNLNSLPPLTVTKGDRQFREDGNPMTPRELARIQGVPDSFKIFMDINNLQYWINKGRVTMGKTPPYEIGQWFYDKLFYGH